MCFSLCGLCSSPRPTYDSSNPNVEIIIFVSACPAEQAGPPQKQARGHRREISFLSLSEMEEESYSRTETNSRATSPELADLSDSSRGPSPVSFEEIDSKSGASQRVLGKIVRTGIPELLARAWKTVLPEGPRNPDDREVRRWVFDTQSGDPVGRYFAYSRELKDTGLDLE